VLSKHSLIENYTVPRENYLLTISLLRLYILIMSMELGTVPRYALQTYPVPVNLMNSIHNNYNGYAKKKPKTNSNFRRKKMLMNTGHWHFALWQVHVTYTFSKI